jgi:hypothetical protein
VKIFFILHLMGMVKECAELISFFVKKEFEIPGFDIQNNKVIVKVLALWYYYLLWNRDLN